MNERTYRFYDNRQGELLPGHISELLPEDHAERGGAPPFGPEMMLKVLLYGYATGIFSARKLSKRCGEEEIG